MRRHVVLLAMGVALVAAVAWAVVRAMAGPQVDVRRVVRRDFVESVVASGHVEAPHRLTIGTQMVGQVIRVPVAEGQSVKAGQVLVELDDAELKAIAAQADAAVSQAAARLRQVSEVDSPVADQGWRQAAANLENARAQRDRAAALLKQGFVGPAAMDDAEKALAVAEAQSRSAQSQRRAALPSGSAAAIAVEGLAQARSAAAAARSRLANATLRAPIAGVLLSRNVEPGDIVQAGMALMTLSPNGATQLVVDIDEKNLHLLALAQPARASADAFADRLFDARVAYINPGVDLQRGSVEVKLDVASPPAWLLQDMTVSVDIQVAQRRQAVLVPLDAVQDAAGALPWVARIDGRRAHRQTVHLGLRSAGFAEVLGGLAEGDLVAAGPGALADGAHVRPLIARP
jgi:HlyD family secretion protein